MRIIIEVSRPVWGSVHPHPARIVLEPAADDRPARIHTEGDWIASEDVEDAAKVLGAAIRELEKLRRRRVAS